MQQQLARGFVYQGAISHNLDRDLSFQDRIVGGIDLTHPASPELALDAIVAKGLARK
jgi:hypothetical protein